MTTAPARIGVLLACHNRRARTLACLHSLIHQRTDARIAVFVYDDASKDGTAEAAAALWPDAVILAGTGQAYWAGGMRAAFVRAAAEDFDAYLWLNDDVVLDPDAIARLTAVARQAGRSSAAPILVGGAMRDPETGMVTYGGIMRRPGSLSPLRFVAAEPGLGGPRRVDTLNGNLVLVPRATVRVVGLLDPGYIHTLADLDYGLRVRRAGGLVLLAPGTLGTCVRNPRALGFFDPATPLAARWRQLFDPLGFPLRPWLHFARRHGGPLWPVFAALPLIRLLLPGRRVAAVQHRARRHAV